MAQEFKAIVTVLDRATAPLRAINRSLTALNAPFKGIRGALIELGQQSGLAHLGATAGNVMHKFGALGTSIGGLLGPLAAVGAAAGAGGMLAMARDAADYGEELDKAVDKTGLAANELARLHHVAEATHIETGVLDKGLVKLNRTLAEAAGGKNKSAMALFHKLKIDIGGMGKPVKTAADVLPKLSDAFMRNENSAMRSRMANTAFGKAGVELIPILKLGSAELNRLSAEYEQYFGKITPQMMKAMRDGDEAFDRASLAAKGLKLSIGAALIPVMTRLIVPLTNWIVNNRELVSQRVASWVTNVGNAMAKVDWNAIGAAISRVARAVGDLAKWLGPMGTVIAGVTIALAPFIVAVLSAGVALGQLAFAIGGVTLRLGALAFGAVIGMIGNFVTAIRAGYSAMAAFNLILAANPIGLVIVGIAALAAAAFLVWKYWKPIKGFFKDLWAGVLSAFDWAWQKIKPIVDAVMNVARFMAGVLKYTPVGMMVQGGSWVVNHAMGGGAVQRFGGAGLPGGNGSNGTVKVKVDFNNLPQGARVNTQASPGMGLDTGVRFAFP